MKAWKMSVFIGLCFSASPSLCSAEEADHSICQRIANTAFAANSNLSTKQVSGPRSAPFLDGSRMDRSFEKQKNGWAKTVETPLECSEWGPLAPSQCLDFFKRFPDRGDRGISEIDAEIVDAYYEENRRWPEWVGFLPFEERLLALAADSDYGIYRGGWSTGVFLESAWDENGLLCVFQNRVHEKLSGAEEVCNAIDAGEVGYVEPDKALPDGTREALFGRRSDNYPKGYIDWDLDGDSLKERLLSYNYSPGHGRCGYFKYDLLSPEPLTEFSESPLRDTAHSAQAPEFDESAGKKCFRSTFLRVHNGELIFERSGLGKRSDSTKEEVHVRKGPLERIFRTIRGGKVEELCRTTFSVEPFVIYERTE